MARAAMTRYFVDYQTVGENGIRRSFGALLDLRRDDLVRAQIDVIACHNDVPEDVRPAMERLIALARAAHEARRATMWGRLASRFRDPLMAVAVDLRVDAHRELIRSFGPFSIDASVYTENEAEPVVTVHDCGAGIVFEGDSDLAAGVETRAGLARGAVRLLDK